MILFSNTIKDVFVNGTRVFGAEDNDEAIVFQSESALRPAASISGTLEQWQNTIGAWCRGNSRLMFCVSAAAAGPLLEPTGSESGGFHFRGPSSIGKSTLLYAAASMIGPPWDGHAVIQKWRSTANALEGMAALHNDQTLLLDEMGECNPVQIGEIAYMLANGSGKRRASRTGAVRRSLNWRLIYLSTGEQSLNDLLVSVQRKSQAGQELRILDIPADAGKELGVFEHLQGHSSAAQFALAIKDTASRVHGAAAQSWLEWLVKNRAKLAVKLPSCVSAFAETYVPSGASGQVQRTARRFALVGTAGELLFEAGIVPWEQGEAEDAAAKLFRDWLTEFGSQDRETQYVFSVVRHFLELHGDSRFESTEPDTERHLPPRDRAGFFRLNRDGSKEWLIFPNVMKHEVLKGQNIKKALNDLREAGYLIPDSQGKNAQNIRLRDLGQTRVYVLCSKIFEDQGNEG